MAQKTNDQVIAFATRMVNKHEAGTEEIAQSIGRYWMNNDLTKEQCNFLNEVQNGLSGPSSINGIYMDEGKPQKVG